MARYEVRGDWRVIVYPDREVWQLGYTDGTLGEPCILTNEDLDSMPEGLCKGCNRHWAASDRNIRYDNNDGRMICPDCQSK